MAKKKPPSRIRYEEKNPQISCRVPKKFKEKILKMQEITGKSISQIFCETLVVAEKEFSDVFEAGNEEGYGEGYADGYEEGMEDNSIWYYCSVCDEKIYIKPNSKSHRDMIELMKNRGWAHAKCLNNDSEE